MTHDPKSMTVALLAGGTSHERDVSLSSGAEVRRALVSLGYMVEDYDPASREDLTALTTSEADVAFIAMHGRGGEDGVIQGFLAAIGMPYTGSGVMASALAMDKHQTKVVYEHNDIPTPDSVVVFRGGEKDVADIIATVGERSVVKPLDDGSTVGVHMVHDEAELIAALEEELAKAPSVLVERYVSGTEITIGVLEDPEPRALPVIEIVVVGHEFYDYEAKYEEGGSEHIIPARIGDELTAEASRLAVQAHVALGCEGMSRTDMMVDEDGRLWVLETNTIPGMTKTSLLPDSARAVGIGFEELCRSLIDDSLRRAAEKETTK